ncbi:hypothetical protein Pla123a_46470 [Posidoniimonas polymericola]|uniref:PEP-CTERM protein-sorting domain-containing protein n=1 Tax=Posidoniimonas polymericola TaxID=2528002 RepID=A0A5C5XWA5_9BACT|nr:hypothetical protein [Posidoniimonas polymericola]TWT66759.1 hypothetical protein Pla123a_46470 [Posidoniimonas polymericola]
MRIRRLVASTFLCLVTSTAGALEVFPLLGSPETDLGTGLGQVNYFADASPFFIDVTAANEGNNIAVYTMDGASANNGAGFSIAVSNGENGIDSTEDGANADVPNLQPVNPAIASVNGGGKLQNGNAFRVSMWMRQDPADPVSAVPQIEPVVKFELWKEAGSGNADFSSTAFPGFGDRIWDTDQNAGDATFNGFNQSQASWVDMNNSGSTSFSKPVAQSLVADEWRLIEATLVIDDDPLDDTLNWSIGGDFFSVDAIEEVRAVMFLGDYAGTNLTGAGSVWVDNVLLEIFATEAELNSTANPNPMPVGVTALSGDFNADGLVNAADYTVWRDNFGAADEGALNGAGNGAGGVDDADYDLWAANYGESTPQPGVAATGAAPEPSAIVLLLGLASAPLLRRGR